MFKTMRSRIRLAMGLSSFAILAVLFTVPLMASASSANRVFYTVVDSSFSPAGSEQSDIPEGYGKGINKLTINAGPVGYDVYFTINNTNESGTSGSTYFETRKGPGGNDLSGNVQLSSVANQFAGTTNSTTLNFPGSEGVPLYVHVYVPPCGSDGSFRIQAHPGGSANQGNASGVMVFVNCNGYVPPTPTTTYCYYSYGQGYICTNQ